MRLEGVPLHLGDERRFAVGMNLESAIAPKDMSHLDGDARKPLEDEGKFWESEGLEPREPQSLARRSRLDCR